MSLKCSTAIKHQNNIRRHKKHGKNIPLKRKNVFDSHGKAFDFQSRLNENKRKHSYFTCSKFQKPFKRKYFFRAHVAECTYFSMAISFNDE